MIPPRTAWFLGRLICGATIAGEDTEAELGLILGEFRPIARYLIGLPSSELQVASESFLCGRADRDEIVAALASVDPLGPAPDIDTPLCFATVADVRRQR